MDSHPHPLSVPPPGIRFTERRTTTQYNKQDRGTQPQPQPQQPQLHPADTIEIDITRGATNSRRTSASPSTVLSQRSIPPTARDIISARNIRTVHNALYMVCGCFVLLSVWGMGFYTATRDTQSKQGMQQAFKATTNYLQQSIGFTSGQQHNPHTQERTRKETIDSCSEQRPQAPG